MMVTLRDPADRAFSSYLYMLKQGQQPGSFLQALETRPELLDHGRYATSLEGYRSVFGPDAIHVAVFDDLVEDPQAFIDALLARLGIDPMTLSEELLAARLPAARARSRAVSRMARGAADVVRERLDGANVIGRVKRSTLVQRVLYVPLGEDKPTMTEQERAAVHEALAEEIDALDGVYGLSLRQRWAWGRPRPPVELSRDAEAS